MAKPKKSLQEFNKKPFDFDQFGFKVQSFFKLIFVFLNTFGPGFRLCRSTHPLYNPINPTGPPVAHVAPIAYVIQGVTKHVIQLKAMVFVIKMPVPHLPSENLLPSSYDASAQVANTNTIAEISRLPERFKFVGDNRNVMIKPPGNNDSGLKEVMVFTKEGREYMREELEKFYPEETLEFQLPEVAEEINFQ